MSGASVASMLYSSQWLSSAATVSLILAVAAFWWAGKRLSVLWDRADLWDAADLWAAALGFVAMSLYQVVLLSYSPTAPAGPPVAMLALRRAAMFAGATWLGTWLLSIWIETETDISTPTGLEPIADRAWQVHLGWVPFSEVMR